MKPKAYLILSVFALSFLPFLAFSQETLTITTYYPSPYGSYKQLYVQDNVGIGTTRPVSKLAISGGSANWNEVTPGLTTGSVHLNPGSATDNYGSAITWGASDTGSGDNAQAGIYVRSDSSYGTKMYLATTDAYVSGSKTRMMIDYNGNVGIGTVNPTAKLHVYTSPTSSAKLGYFQNASGIAYIEVENIAGYWGAWGVGNTGTTVATNGQLSLLAGSSTPGYFDGQGIRINTAGNVGIGMQTPSEKLEVNGNVKAIAFYYSSDERLKTNITRLSNSLEQVAMLNGSSFAWKADGKKDIGLTAQNVEKVYPELVKTDPKTGLKSLEYGRLIAPLVEAVKTLKKQNENQETQIRQLQSQLKELKKKLGKSAL